MKCPNCQNEMKNKSYWYYGISDWDMDYPSTLHEEYRCSKCNISFINGEWKLPNSIPVATDKQIKMVAFINSVLQMNYEPILKYPTIKFISKYVDKANQKKNNSKYFDDDWDWMYMPDEEF